MSKLDAPNLEKHESQVQDEHSQLNLVGLASAKHKPQAGLCDETDDSKLLSMLGPILSFEVHSQGSCPRAAHPFGQTTWHAVDLRRMNPDFALGNGYEVGEPAKLTDYFPAKDLHAALIKDSVVKKALSTIDVEPKDVKTLDELLKSIGRGIVYANPSDDGKSDPLCFSMNKDLLSNFAFDHVEGGKVAVRIGLSGTGVCRENLTQIGILLPIPDALKQATRDAQTGKGGFLMERKDKPKSSYSWQFESP